MPLAALAALKKAAPQAKRYVRPDDDDEGWGGRRGRKWKERRHTQTNKAPHAQGHQYPGCTKRRSGCRAQSFALAQRARHVNISLPPSSPLFPPHPYTQHPRRLPPGSSSSSQKSSHGSRSSSRGEGAGQQRRRRRQTHLHASCQQAEARFPSRLPQGRSSSSSSNSSSEEGRGEGESTC